MINPISEIITAITALVAAVKLYEQNSAEAVALDKLKANTTVLLANANAKLQDSYSKLEAQLRILNQLSAQEKKDLQDKLSLLIKNAEAELMLMQAKQQAIGKGASKPTLWQSVKATTAGTLNQQEEALNYYSWENSKQAMSEYNDGINTLKDNISKLKDQKGQLDQIKAKLLDSVLDKAAITAIQLGVSEEQAIEFFKKHYKEYDSKNRRQK